MLELIAILFQKEYKWWQFQIRKTPCLLKSLLYGAIGGVSVGAIHYASRSQYTLLASNIRSNVYVIAVIILYWYTLLGVFVKAYDYGIIGYVVTSISAWSVSDGCVNTVYVAIIAGEFADTRQLKDELSKEEYFQRKKTMK